MKRLIPLTLLSALAVGASAQAAPSQATILSASVGPGRTITLTKGGKRVTTLKPGRYVIRVSDRSSSHNFHLRGPGGVNKATTVPFTGRAEIRVRLRAGTYRYVCDPHSDDMRGSFRVR
jgi:plastocyanin